MMARQGRVYMQVVVDVILFFAVCIPYILVVLKVAPVQRGFYCDDESIRYPYVGDTVTPGILMGTSLGLPLISFLSVELPAHCVGRRSKWLRRCFKTIAKLMGLYLFGLTVTMGLTEAGKLTIGRLRPYFIDACRPDFSKINCSEGYIRDAMCTNTEEPNSIKVRESRKSFPSGHASFAFYVAVFLAYYFHERIKVSFSVLLKPVLQSCLMLAAVFCSLSRVKDNMHHPGDVAGGALLGLLVALWMVFTLSRTFGYRHYRLGLYQRQGSQDSSETTNFERLQMQYKDEENTHSLSGIS